MYDTATIEPWATRITGSGSMRADALIPNERNWRSHGVGQQAALSRVLAEIGWVAGTIVNLRSSDAWGEQRGRQTMVDGHLRAELALRQGPETEVPVTFVDLDPDEERVVLASLDPISAMASADRDKLQELLVSIQSEDEAVRGLIESIARQERIELPAMTGLVNPDEVLEPPAEPVSRLGDLWLLGGHKLLCGDSTKVEDVRRLMADERAALMAIDPPYLCFYDGGNHPQTWAKNGRRISSEEKTRHWDDYIDHDTSVAFYADFLRAALDEALQTPQ